MRRGKRGRNNQVSDHKSNHRVVVGSNHKVGNQVRKNNLVRSNRLFFLTWLPTLRS